MINEISTKTCCIFGDESGNIGVDKFSAIGTVGTRNPKDVINILKEIRLKTHFNGEVSYKSSDDRRTLCAIRWMDWFFGCQNIARFKIVV